MGLILYLFGAVMLVLIAGWTAYELPGPGAMSPWELSGAIFPALLIMGGVLASTLAAVLAGRLFGFLRRMWRHMAG